MSRIPLLYSYRLENVKHILMNCRNHVQHMPPSEWYLQCEYFQFLSRNLEFSYFEWIAQYLYVAQIYDITLHYIIFISSYTASRVRPRRKIRYRLNSWGLLPGSHYSDFSARNRRFLGEKSARNQHGSHYNDFSPISRREIGDFSPRYRRENKWTNRASRDQSCD